MSFMKNINIIFHKEKIMVMGLGVTGLPVIKKLLELGNRIIALDNNTSLDWKKIFSAAGSPPEGALDIILAHEQDIHPDILKDVSMIITSPGIPSSNNLFTMASEWSVPVWDELELSWRLLDEIQRSNMIAVTGTNGKTTVVNLMGNILSGAGIKNMVCGNVGSPLLNTIKIDPIARKARHDNVIRVVEVSSFQLERTYSFKPGTAVLLNITSDHIDRHGCIEEYAGMKMKLFSNQKSSDFAIVNIDDRVSASKTEEISAIKDGPSLLKYSMDKKNAPDIWYGDGNIYYELPSSKGNINIKGSLLKGNHNISNTLAAAAASLLAGASPEIIGLSVKNFKPLSHRMEYLGEIAGIRCINDSKSTNPDSVMAALRDFSREVTIIMGGLDKDMDFTPVLPSIEASVNSIILIGQSALRMEKLFRGLEEEINVYKCSSMEEAVKKGFEVTRPGDVLLLSPGCASMDMFRDYKDRGEQFKKAVMGKNQW
jgi:UDP-N-acetylmuramoylalanine--D-glutamate ligase